MFRINTLFLLVFFLFFATSISFIEPAESSGEQTNSCLLIADDFNLDSMQSGKDRVEAIYNAAGFCVNFLSVPIKRAMKMLNQSRSDGLLIRSKKYLNSINISAITTDEPVMTAGYRIVFEKSRFDKSLSSFYGSTIGIYSSVNPAEVSAFSRYNIEVFEFSLNDSARFIKLIDLHRIDGFLLDTHQIQIMVDKGEIPIDKYGFSEIVEKRVGFLVLHPKHSEKIPKLNNAIRDLKNFGETVN